MVKKPAILTGTVSCISNNETVAARAAHMGAFRRTGQNRRKRPRIIGLKLRHLPPTGRSIAVPFRSVISGSAAVPCKPSTKPTAERATDSKPPALPWVLHHPHHRARRARAPMGSWSIALRWVPFHHRELGSMSLYYHLFCRRDHRVLLVIAIAIIAGSDRGSGVSGAKGRADKHTRFSRRKTDILISKSMSMRRRASGD